MHDHNLIRVALALCLVAAGSVLAFGAASAETSAAQTEYQRQAQLPYDEREPVVEPRPGGPVVATGQKSPAPGTQTKALYAFSSNGRLRYYNERIGIGDVDPSPEGNMTVMIPPQERFGRAGCPGATKCSRQFIERVNLTTGDRERLFSYMTARHRATNWHDVDRVGEHEYAIASIAHDRVWVVNVTTGVTEWAWSAQTEYNLSSGGPFPGDWTHLNDVDRLPDGRYMLSLRNQDQVVFVDPETGLEPEWTLGCDNCHHILHEQHNPDYIPESDGGPAVVVADSENNRIVEYQRRNGSWERTWVWQDRRIDWPRDADRLPNGNTLVADSHGNRLLEIAPNGSVVWQVTVGNPYNVEDLSTGDGSTGGPSAVRADLTSRTAPNRPLYINGSDPTMSNSWMRLQWNKLQFVLPDWMSPNDVLFTLVVCIIPLLWAGIELHWRGWRFRRPFARR